MNAEDLINNKDIETLAGRYYRYLDSYSKKDLEQEFFLYCFERIDNIEDKDIINLCKECYKKILYKQSNEVIGVSCDFLEEIKEEETTDIYITTKNRQDLSYKEYYQEHIERRLKYFKEYYRKHSEELKARRRESYYKNIEEERAASRERARKHRKERCEYSKKYYKEHSEERKAYIKEWQKKNEEHLKEYRKEYCRKHKEEINAKRKEKGENK